MSTQALPDIEAAVIEYLLDNGTVSGVGTRIYSEPIADVATPFLTVTRIGGEVDQAPHWLDRALLEVVGWSEDRAEARDACAQAVAALHDLPPGVWNEAVISAVEDAVQPRNIPDPTTSASRFVAEVRVTYHPAPAGS